MANVIYKYPLNIESYAWIDVPKIHKYAWIDVPKIHKICDIGVQNGKAFVWVLHEKEAECDFRLALRVFATGEQLPEPDKIGFFLKTIHMPPFVWHIFEESSHDHTR